MTRKEAKEQLKKALETQKTITVPKLKKLLEILNYDQIERQYKQTQKKVRRQRKELQRRNTNR